MESLQLRSVGGLIFDKEDGHSVATVWGEGLTTTEQNALTRRIVDSFNSCQGLNPTEIPAMMARLEEINLALFRLGSQDNDTFALALALRELLLLVNDTGEDTGDAS